jgi:hypothetical protein
LHETSAESSSNIISIDGDFDLLARQAQLILHEAGSSPLNFFVDIAVEGADLQLKGFLIIFFVLFKIIFFSNAAKRAQPFPLEVA